MFTRATKDTHAIRTRARRVPAAVRDVRKGNNDRHRLGHQ